MRRLISILAATVLAAALAPAVIAADPETSLRAQIRRLGVGRAPISIGTATPRESCTTTEAASFRPSDDRRSVIFATS